MSQLQLALPTFMLSRDITFAPVGSATAVDDLIAEVIDLVTGDILPDVPPLRISTPRT